MAERRRDRSRGILYDVNAARHLRVTPLLIEELFLVVSAGGWPHEVGDDGIAKKPVTLAECAEFGLILPHRTHGLREMIERFAHTQGVNLHIILEMDSLAHIKALIARGLGYGILAHAAVAEKIERGSLVLVPIREPAMWRTVYLVRNPSRPVTQATLEVENLTLDIVAELKKLWRGQLAPARTKRDAPARQRRVTNRALSGPSDWRCTAEDSQCDCVERLPS